MVAAAVILKRRAQKALAEARLRPGKKGISATSGDTAALEWYSKWESRVGSKAALESEQTIQRLVIAARKGDVRTTTGGSYGRETGLVAELGGRGGLRKTDGEGETVISPGEGYKRMATEQAIREGVAEQRRQRMPSRTGRPRYTETQYKRARSLRPEAQRKEFGREIRDTRPKPLTPTQRKRARGMREFAQKKEFGRVVQDQDVYLQRKESFGTQQFRIEKGLWDRYQEALKTEMIKDVAAKEDLLTYDDIQDDLRSASALFQRRQQDVLKLTAARRFGEAKSYKEEVEEYESLVSGYPIKEGKYIVPESEYAKVQKEFQDIQIAKEKEQQKLGYKIQKGWEDINKAIAEQTTHRILPTLTKLEESRIKTLYISQKALGGKKTKEQVAEEYMGGFRAAIRQKIYPYVREKPATVAAIYGTPYAAEQIGGLIAAGAGSLLVKTAPYLPVTITKGLYYGGKGAAALTKLGFAGTYGYSKVKEFQEAPTKEEKVGVVAETGFELGLLYLGGKAAEGLPAQFKFGKRAWEITKPKVYAAAGVGAVPPTVRAVTIAKETGKGIKKTYLQDVEFQRKYPWKKFPKSEKLRLELLEEEPIYFGSGVQFRYQKDLAAWTEPGTMTKRIIKDIDVFVKHPEKFQADKLVDVHGYYEKGVFPFSRTAIPETYKGKPEFFISFGEQTARKGVGMWGARKSDVTGKLELYRFDKDFNDFINALKTSGETKIVTKLEAAKDIPTQYYSKPTEFFRKLGLVKDPKDITISDLPTGKDLPYFETYKTSKFGYTPLPSFKQTYFDPKKVSILKAPSYKSKIPQSSFAKSVSKSLSKSMKSVSGSYKLPSPSKSLSKSMKSLSKSISPTLKKSISPSPYKKTPSPSPYGKYPSPSPYRYRSPSYRPSRMPYPSLSITQDITKTAPAGFFMPKKKKKKVYGKKKKTAKRKRPSYTPTLVGLEYLKPIKATKKLAGMPTGGFIPRPLAI